MQRAATLTKEPAQGAKDSGNTNVANASASAAPEASRKSSSK